MTTMDELIEEILAEYDDSERRVPRPQRLFIDLDSQILHPVRLERRQRRVEVNGATAVFTTCRVEVKHPLDIGDIEIVDCMHARASQLALDACVTDQRAAQILAALLKGEFLLRIKFMRSAFVGRRRLGC